MGDPQPVSCKCPTDTARVSPGVKRRHRNKDKMSGKADRTSHGILLAPHSLAILLKISDDERPQFLTRTGRDIFSDFVAQNRNSFWNKDLVSGINRIDYLGWFDPQTLFVQGSEKDLEALRDAWTRRSLRPPRQFVIESLGDVCQVQLAPVSQSHFIPLPDVLCQTIAELNCGKGIATQAGKVETDRMQRLGRMTGKEKYQFKRSHSMRVPSEKDRSSSLGRTDSYRMGRSKTVGFNLTPKEVLQDYYGSEKSFRLFGFKLFRWGRSSKNKKDHGKGPAKQYATFSGQFPPEDISRVPCLKQSDRRPSELTVENLHKHNLEIQKQFQDRGQSTSQTVTADVHHDDPQGSKGQEKVGAIYQFELEGEDGGTFYLDLKNGGGDAGVGPPPNEEADVVMTMSVTDMQQLFSGELRPFQAYSSGRLHVVGSLRVATRLEDVVSRLKTS
uniref:SCP2 domain-containing protein n=1 Tax=Branchiostoma floridae TaxID=7739 RepID=C3XQE6_BRAFL|eukprot:XP_002613750.1 hypothetical protein BRAFLDRAFT_84506 [Branchiostoma floridae]